MFDWLMSPFTVMPIQIFNWTSRPDPAFHANAAAASLVLVVLTLSMNATAIWFALSPAQKPQVVINATLSGTFYDHGNPCFHHGRRTQAQGPVQEPGLFLR